MYSLFYKEKNDFELYDIDSTHIPPHLHKNIEFTYVLEGTLVCGIGTKLYNMEKVTSPSSSLNRSTTISITAPSPAVFSTCSVSPP
jgi:hypothetical protein